MKWPSGNTQRSITHESQGNTGGMVPAMKGKEFTRGRSGFHFNLLTFLTHVDINTVVMWLFFFLESWSNYRHTDSISCHWVSKANRLSHGDSSWKDFDVRSFYLYFKLCTAALFGNSLDPHDTPGQTNGCNSHHLLNYPRSLDVGMESKRFRLFRVTSSAFSFTWLFYVDCTALTLRPRVFLVTSKSTPHE